MCYANGERILNHTHNRCSNSEFPFRSITCLRKKVEILNSRSEWWEHGNVSDRVFKDNQQLKEKS